METLEEKPHSVAILFIGIAASSSFQHTRDVRLFELGTVFRRGAEATAPMEGTRVAGVLTGAREPAHWSTSGKAAEVDRWDLRAAFEATRDRRDARHEPEPGPALA